MGKRPRRTPAEKARAQYTNYAVKEPMELMEFLAAKMPDASRTKLKSLLSKRVVFVDNVITTQFNFPLEAGMKVQISKQKGKKEFNNRLLKIVYEDAYIIVVEKMQGLLSVNTERQKERTAYTILNEYVQRSGRQFRVFIVHRLDRALSLDLAHRILQVLADVRREGKVMTYLRPDAKSQVTIEYDDNGTPVRIDTIVVSTQHDDFVQPADDSDAAQLKADEEMLAQIRRDVIEILMPRVIASIHHEKVLALFNDRITYHVNPTGKFVIGGPHGDTGLTGRKIIVDTYGGKGAHGGGAFSGKDPSKVDRSAAYAARHIAKNLVAAGVADEMLVQVSYAIGVARPINIFVDTYDRSHVNMSDGEIARKIDELFDLRPKAIEDRLKLRNPIYQETAAYGHMGREPQTIVKHFKSRYEGNKDIEVELFTWEKLDYVDKVKAAFGL